MSTEDDEKTRVIRKPRPESPPTSGSQEPEKIAVPPDESEMTRLIGPPRRSPSSPAPKSAEDDTAGSPSDPTVGWVVVVQGPGRGALRKLGYGQNSVGREVTERVCLDFGDDSLSRKGHCFVIYEPRKRQFILRPGDSMSLTYLNGELVAAPTELQAGAMIEMGETTLRFVPLCGPDFDWQEQTVGNPSA
jgi:hypothetical protein